MNTGVNPSGSAITKDGKIMLVANNNNYGLPNEDSVTFLNLKSKLPIKTLFHPSFSQPYTITIDCHTNLAYVTNSNSPETSEKLGRITVIDIKKRKVVKVIESKLLDGPSGMTIVGRDAFVINYGAPGGVKSGNGKSMVRFSLDSPSTNNLELIDLDVIAPAAITSTDKNNLYIAFYNDGNPGTGFVTEYKVHKSSITLKRSRNGFSGPFDIKVSRDRKEVYVSNFGSNNFAPFGRSVSILYKDNSIQEINVGIQPSGLSLVSDDILAVTCYNTLYSDPVNYTGLIAGQGSLILIDIPKRNIFKMYRTGASPSNVVSYDGICYVSCYAGNVIDIIKP